MGCRPNQSQLWEHSESWASTRPLEDEMSQHKIQIEFLLLTPRRRIEFLKWALKGFKALARPLKKTA